MHFPACATFGSVIRFNKIVIELFDVAIHSPAFTIDYHVHEVRSWRRNL